MADETGLKFRWGKCHLHGTKQTIEKCRQIRTPPLPTALTLHESLSLSYLQTPIGTNDFVNDCLMIKLVALQEIRKAITEMEWKHEAATLLKHCSTYWRIVHLM